MGVNIFTWKDTDGTIVLDEKKRISFGTCDTMQKNTVWLERQFARIPDVPEQSVELSVIKSGEPEKVIEVKIPALKEAELQKLGVEMNDDLTVSLVLKNDTSQTKSNPVSIL